MAGTNVGTQVYATVSSTATQTFTITATRTQQVARYFADDLRDLIREANIDLPYWLEIPPEEQDYLLSSEDLAELLCNDIEQMLRDKLISGVHFMLSELQPDPNTNKFNLKYHVNYQINLAQRTLSNDPLLPFGGRLEVPDAATTAARFVLVIDWVPGITPENIEGVRRPHYFFDWYAPTDRFDSSCLVSYRMGGMDDAGSGVVVTRVELTAPGNVP
jgi:hypothetical protein